jgi:hypothetical protein
MAYTCGSARYAVRQTLSSLPLISSWEFVTTLDYEWSVFRRRRQYLWTIWVSSCEKHFSYDLRNPLGDLELIFAYNRSTPSRVWPPFWL